MQKVSSPLVVCDTARRGQCALIVEIHIGIVATVLKASFPPLFRPSRSEVISYA